MLGCPYPVLVTGPIKQGLVTVIVSSEILFIGCTKADTATNELPSHSCLHESVQYRQETPPLLVFVTGWGWGAALKSICHGYQFTSEQGRVC